MKIQHFVNDQYGVVVVTISGHVSGGEFAKVAARLFGDRTQLLDYNCVIDLRDYDGDIGNSDLEGLRQMSAQQRTGPRPERHSIIVTSDPHFELWAAALDEQFSGRKHHVVRSLEAAFSLLEKVKVSTAA
ncbi:MAG: hypothetical protein JWO33_1008 [Caulobacteraceae bacterium]|nr:hypothetical protein [Caulobacteraceae bacterium]